jgi:hypothetical protein
MLEYYAPRQTPDATVVIDVAVVAVAGADPDRHFRSRALAEPGAQHDQQQHKSAPVIPTCASQGSWDTNCWPPGGFPASTALAASWCNGLCIRDALVSRSRLGTAINDNGQIVALASDATTCNFLIRPRCCMTKESLPQRSG